jgi:hypothetical protein
MVHQLCETVLHNRFLLRESLRSIHTHKRLKPFPACGWEWKRIREAELLFSAPELTRIRVQREREREERQRERRDRERGDRERQRDRETERQRERDRLEKLITSNLVSF